VNFSVPTDSERVRFQFEPKAPPLAKRWAALRQLKDAGVAIGICVTPTLPIEEPSRFADLIADFAPAVVVCQDFHSAGGRFGADTGANALSLLDALGWGPHDYRHFVDLLRRRVTVYEGESGFFPPPAVAASEVRTDVTRPF
jgi:hypothetical protein